MVALGNALRHLPNAKEDAPLPRAGDKDLATSLLQRTKRSGAEVTTRG